MNLHDLLSWWCVLASWVWDLSRVSLIPWRVLMHDSPFSSERVHNSVA